jgi:hypothetical protein
MMMCATCTTKTSWMAGIVRHVLMTAAEATQLTKVLLLYHWLLV